MFSQDFIKSTDFEFKFIKAKIAKGSNYYYAIKTPKNHDKIQVRFKLKSLKGTKESFDPNKLYLVSDEQKIRIRPIDVRYNYGVGMIYIGFQFLSDKKLTDKNLEGWISYKPDVRDTFVDFKLENYEDICHQINFGTKKGPHFISPYLDHEALKSCKLDIYFSVPENSLRRGKVFYGKTLISNFNLK